MSIPLVVGISVGLLGFNAFVTYFVVRNNALLNKHKVVQCCFVWLLPVVGGLISVMFMRSIQEMPLDKPSPHIPDNNEYPSVNLHSHIGGP